MLIYLRIKGEQYATRQWNICPRIGELVELIGEGDKPLILLVTGVLHRNHSNFSRIDEQEIHLECSIVTGKKKK